MASRKEISSVSSVLRSDLATGTEGGAEEDFSAVGITFLLVAVEGAPETEGFAAKHFRISTPAFRHARMSLSSVLSAAVGK
jgi:NADH:ubiquinone oxidoreductase subunit 2 (subunit N)